MRAFNLTFKITVVLVFLWLVVAILAEGSWYLGPVSFQGTARILGGKLFTSYVYPFEIVAILLLAAMVGAIYMAKKEVTK
jgi:NADH:ubiquinone oxidoreductase subunit 6 (subunit J)